MQTHAMLFYPSPFRFIPKHLAMYRLFVAVRCCYHTNFLV